MTVLLFRDDAYLRRAPARVDGLTPDGGIVLDQTIFYPTGGGQPGDSGHLDTPRGTIRVTNAMKGEGNAVILLPEPGQTLPMPGATVMQVLDWDRRYAHMRMHTALHLLSVVIPLPVTGGAIGAGRGRLDFDMPEPPSHWAELDGRLNALAARDLAVTTEWITDDALLANPGLVKTMSVRPPLGQGRVRLVRIGTGADRVDLQPCGGTHVARTGEIGPMRIERIENKGRQNRRVSLVLGG